MRGSARSLSFNCPLKPIVDENIIFLSYIPQLTTIFIYLCYEKSIKNNGIVYFYGLSEQELILNKLMQAHELQMPVIEAAKQEALLLQDRKPCPHCHSKNIYKRGIQNGIKIYTCKDCKKWYSQTTGTPLWDIKLKSKWSNYLRCMSENYSLRKSALEVGICLQTSFDWRHKILASLNPHCVLSGAK